MRKRWEHLTTCAVIAVVGLFAFWIKDGGPTGAWAFLESTGMVLCALTAITALVKSSARKWPAGVALACALPAAQNVVLSFPLTTELILHHGVPYLLFLSGAVGTAVSSVVILLMPPPPPGPSDEVVAKARIVR